MSLTLERTKDRSIVAEGELSPYELFMLFLCTFSLVSLAAETFFHLGTKEEEILDTIDNVVCVVFFLDFLIGLSLSRDKLKFLKWGWIDLISSVPVIDQLRAGRIVRVIRILRVLRGIRIVRILARYLQSHRADGTILAVIFFSFLLIVLSSVAILQVETSSDSNIKSASDALWWATVTVTTVGYGDKYPVTDEGRIIACVLMISGVGIFGILSGSIASWIMKPVERRQEIDLSSIHIELEAIRQRLDGIDSRDLPAFDPQLKRIVDAWPYLSNKTRDELQNLTKRT